MAVKKNKPTKRISVPRTRNAGTQTESEYFGKIRSALRKAFQYWKPMQIALENSSRPNQSANKKLKKEYACKECSGWFPRTEVHIDHIVEVGSLRSLSDIPSFIERLTIEDSKGFDVLCKPCHQVKTNKARKNAKSSA